MSTIAGTAEQAYRLLFREKQQRVPVVAKVALHGSHLAAEVAAVERVGRAHRIRRRRLTNQSA